MPATPKKNTGTWDMNTTIIAFVLYLSVIFLLIKRWSRGNNYLHGLSTTPSKQALQNMCSDYCWIHKQNDMKYYGRGSGSKVFTPCLKIIHVQIRHIINFYFLITYYSLKLLINS